MLILSLCILNVLVIFIVLYGLYTTIQIHYIIHVSASLTFKEAWECFYLSIFLFVHVYHTLCQIGEQVVHHIALLRLGTQPIACEVQQRGGFYGCVQVLGIECFYFVYEGGAAAKVITLWSSVGPGDPSPEYCTRPGSWTLPELGGGDQVAIMA